MAVVTLMRRVGLLVLGIGRPTVSKAVAQERPDRIIHVSALPALDYNSDDGFGYGVVGGVYAYRGADRRIYRWSLEPTVFFTTGGRREVVVLFDAPSLLTRSLRVTMLTAWERDCCYPYFGLGNGTGYDPALSRPISGPNYYSYRRERASLVVNTQWSVYPSLRLLAGWAAYRSTASSRGPNTLFADDSGTGQIPANDFAALSMGPKVGVIFDTRDRERDPQRGVWIEALAWLGSPSLGSKHSFTRYTGTARAYWPLAENLTLAGRVLGEQVGGAMPVTMLADLSSSFRDFPGVGGAKSIRGVLKSRYMGHSRLITNVELRWRAGEWRFVGQRWRPGLVAYVDGGRVWSRDVSADTTGLHWGRGVGLRLKWGDAFIVALDLAHGAEAGVQTYVGLGHVF